MTEKGEDDELHPDGLSEVVADKGYHSDRTLIELEDQGLRSYLSEPDRGRRKWKDDVDAQQAVYANRRRIRGERGKRLHRMRGELIERPFAHLYETGGMRRTHLRGHTNILKRLLIHTAGFNLGLVMRTWIGVGTPRGLQGGSASPDQLACVPHDLSGCLPGRPYRRSPPGTAPATRMPTHLRGQSHGLIGLVFSSTSRMTSDAQTNEALCIDLASSRPQLGTVKAPDD